MLFKGTMMTAQSGKFAGLVASHNRGGQYARNFSIPTNPNTARQGTIRGYLGALANIWSNTLTPEQRFAWTAYADGVPLINRLGEARSIPALAMFIRCNSPRLLSGLTRIDDAPVDQNLGILHPPAVDILVPGASPTVDIAFDVTDTWYTTGGEGALLVFASAAVSETINFFRGPYQYQGAITPGTPSPVTFPLLRPVSAGQAVFFRFIASAGDGRLSQEMFGRFPAQDVAPMITPIVMTGTTGTNATETSVLFTPASFVSVTDTPANWTITGGVNITAVALTAPGEITLTVDADPTGETVQLIADTGMVRDPDTTLSLPQSVIVT